MKNKYTIIIPAYNPNIKLIKLLESLNLNDAKNIIIINDGSKNKKIFEKIEKMKNSKIVIIHHTKNLGKGAALKTGLNYISKNSKDIVGVVTVDADGQHISNDISIIGKTLINNPESLILGCRNFNKNTPMRSKIGNCLTIFIFKYILKIPVNDTQTGLRGIPLSRIESCLNIKYNNYEFETAMLLQEKNSRHKIIEIPIQTVYINKNKSSHFRPIKDSIRIYATIFKFIIKSIKN